MGPAGRAARAGRGSAVGRRGADHDGGQCAGPVAVERQADDGVFVHRPLGLHAGGRDRRPGAGRRVVLAQRAGGGAVLPALLWRDEPGCLRRPRQPGAQGRGGR